MGRGFGLLVCVMSVVIAGCGGRGSGAAGSAARPSVTVDWPTRGRDVTGPSSALSCQFTLHAQEFSAADLVISGDRPSAPAAVNSTYTAKARAKPGLWNLSGSFYPLAGEVGSPVGSVSQQVRIQKDGSLTMPDGSALNVSFNPVIVSAQVSAGQTVMVGSSAFLVASAYDASNNVVVVTPGSFVFSLSSGGSYLSVAPSGLATGLAIGSDSVAAAIDGVTSDAQSVAVTPVIKSVAIDSADIAYDPSRDTLWVVGSFNSFTYGGQVVPVDPSTGKIGSPISLTDFAILVAVTNDSNYLYVAGYSGTLERVVLATGTVDQTIQLPSGTQAGSIVPVPGTQNSVAVALVSINDGQTDAGTVIYDVATPRPNSALMGQSIALNDPGTRIYGFQRFQSSNSLYTTANVDANGISGANPRVTALQGFGNRIHWLNGKILGDDGSILDPDSGTLLGSLTFTTVDHVAAPIPGTNLAYYAAWDPVQIQEFDIGSKQMLFDSPLGPIPGGIDKAIYIGGNRVAFRSFGASTNAVYILRGLPN